MKFENDHIRIVIEKKELTEEQKELYRAKRRKRRPYVITAMVLVVAVAGAALYGHYHTPQEEGAGKLAEAEQEQSQDTVTVDSGEKESLEASAQEEQEDELLETANYVTAIHLATSTKEKYKDTTIYDYTYGEAVEELERGEAITVQMEFDPYSFEELDNWGYFYKIFQNADLTGEVVGSSYDWDESTGTLRIAPPNWAPGCIATSGMEAETVNRYDHSQYILFDQGSGMSWGNLGTLYLACYYDEKTGEKLDQPIVRIVTLKAELEDTPVLNYSILEDGRPEFSWTPVEGAAEYIICRIEYSPEKGFEHMMYPLGTSEETRWTTEAVEFSNMARANKDFTNYRMSQDEWKDEYNHDFYKDEYEPGTVVKWEWAEESDRGVCVIAVAQDGTSMMSNVFFYSELAPNLPSTVALNTEKENGFRRDYEAVEDFPAYDYVTMCDGVTNQKLIDYHTDEASVTPKRVWYTDEEGNYLSGETLNYLVVPYVVEGTPFSYTMELADYDESDLKADMKFLEDREEKLRRKAGDRGPSAMRERDVDAQDRQEQVRQVEDVEIFANSALGEYLAVNMLGGVKAIDLSEFPEAKDTSLVEDIFMEAYYQNPLILGVQRYKIDRRKMMLYVAYDDDSGVQARKQKEIQEKLKEVIGQIVTADMTDEEIELAINQYLCDTITYDQDALDNAEENGFAYVDESFNDSFTAYGALINGRCVCSGYAAAFKLLAETAGLESIVVTGILDGGLSHAWNKIKLGDDWQIVDVTNNDMDYISNALLNLPNFAGERVLVEDKAFMTDKRIGHYKGDSESSEYYHMMEQYFPVEEMAEQLAEGLQKSGEATLRTEYDLDDDRFYEITDAVYKIMGDDVDLYGFYWLGVIYLNTEGF